MTLPTIEESLSLCLAFINERGTSNLNTFQLYVVEQRKVNQKYTGLKSDKSGISILKEIADNTFLILSQSNLIAGNKTSFTITRQGKTVLKTNPNSVGLNYLQKKSPDLKELIDENKEWYLDCKKLNEFLFRLQKKYIDDIKEAAERKSSALELAPKQPTLFPSQTNIHIFCQDYELEVKSQLLKYLQKEDPYEFEKIALYVAFRILFGEHSDKRFREVCELTQKAKDGGIDGIVTKINRKVYYVQAKRYADKNIVTEVMIRDFCSAVGKRGVTGGYFITASSFNDKARIAAEEYDKDINLIDGNQLIDYMIQFGIGLKEVPIPSKLVSGTIHIFDEESLKKIKTLI